MSRRRPSNPGTGWTARHALAPRRAALALTCAALLVPGAPAGAGACGRAGAPAGAGPPEARARFLMGTRLSIEMDGPVPAGAFDGAFGEVARLEEILSNWKATSEISRLNARAARSEFLCSRDLYRAIRVSLEWAERSGGAFDPTVEPLVRALGLRSDEERADPEEASAAVPAPAGSPPVGWRHVRLGPAARSVRFDAAGVGIDLGGIGKGIALASPGVIRGDCHGGGAGRDVGRRPVDGAVRHGAGARPVLGGASQAAGTLSVARS